MKARLYADFDSAITAAFSGHCTPILLLPSAIREPMKNNAYLFNNTIYQTDQNFVFQYEYVHSMLPICYGKIGYILGLPRILAPNQTTLNCIKSHAIVHGNKLYKDIYLPYLVYKDSSLQIVYLLNCHNLIFDYYLCSQRLDILEHLCFENQSKCEVENKSYNRTQLRITEFKLLMATKANCAILAQGVTTKIAKPNNGAYFIPYNFCGAIVCSDRTSIPSQILTFDYTIKYTERYVHRLPQELEEYNVVDWTDY